MMQNLIIEASKSTPAITFLLENNTLEIKGESYPENAAAFYGSVFTWIEQYLASINDVSVTLNLELVYFNSSSSKVLLDIFDLLEAASEHNAITVNWRHHEENDMSLEYGEEFQEEVDQLTFNLISFSD